MAPEVAQSNNYGFPGDVYSLGVLLYEIFERAIPYDTTKGKITFPDRYPVLIIEALILIASPLPLNFHALTFYFQSEVIVKPCLNPDPKLRPTAKEVQKVVDDSIKETIIAVIKVVGPDDRKAINALITRPEDVSDMLQAVYTFMLSRKPEEVDQLIRQAAAAAQQ